MSPLSASWRATLKQREFVVTLGCCFILGLGHSFVLPFLSIFGTKEVGMMPIQFGVFMTVTSLCGIAVSTYLSRASDLRLSRKFLLAVGGLTGALGHVGYAFVRDFWLLLAIGMCFLGVASVTFGQVFAHARDLLSRSEVPERDAPFYMNIFRLFFALAWTVGPACAAWTMQAYSFEGTFLTAAALFTCFTLLVVLFIPDIPPSEKTRAAAQAVPLRLALRTPQLMPHFVAFAIFFICTTMGMMNLPLLILDTLGGTETQVGFAFSVAPVFELPFMFYLGVLATRISHGTLIRASLSVAVVYYLGLSLSTEPVHVYMLQVLSAGIVAIMGGVAITFFQNFLPDQAGTATNIYVTAQRFGSTVGYLLFGSLMVTLGHRAIFTVCSLGALFSFLLLWISKQRVRPTLT